MEAQDISCILHVWLFGQLIGNTDMHDGNLSFLPGQREDGTVLQLAPIYDMLPMTYAPVRGVELPARHYVPRLPLPAEAAAWQDAARAAMDFWKLAATDQRISAGFRRVCRDNAALPDKVAPRQTPVRRVVPGETDNGGVSKASVAATDRPMRPLQAADSIESTGRSLVPSPTP